MKEEKIIKIKIETGVSFSEARKEYAKLNGEFSYAGICKAQDRINNIRREDEIKMLKEEIHKLKEAAKETEKDNEIKKLRQELNQMHTIYIENQLLKEEVQKLREKQAREIFRIPIEISEDETNLSPSEMQTEDQRTNVEDNSKTDESLAGLKRRKKVVNGPSAKRAQSKETILTANSETDQDSVEDESSETTFIQKMKEIPPKAKRGRPPKQQNVTKK